MRTIPLLPFLLIACAAPRHLELAPQVPPMTASTPPADLERDAGQRAAADRSPSRPMTEMPTMNETTVAFRSVVEVVEVPQPVAADPGDQPQARYYYDNWQPEGDRYRYRERRAGWFPVGTVVGAGVGAVIGNQSGRRGRGAWIGGGLGLLFDLNRTWW
jgi:Glycine-zipper domain